MLCNTSACTQSKQMHIVCKVKSVHADACDCRVSHDGNPSQFVLAVFE